MKAWILAAVVAAVLVLVGVPAVALTVGSHDTDDGGRATPLELAHQSKGPDGHHHWAARWGSTTTAGVRTGCDLETGTRRSPCTSSPPSSATHGRPADERATQLHKAATCLRQNSDAGKCLKRSFSPPRPRG